MARQRMERRTFSCSRAGGALWLRLALLIATLLPFSVRVFAATPPLVPDTPAGHILQLWLDAFDSGDAGKLASYKQHYDPSDSFATSAAFQQQTGGFDLVAIEKSEPLRVSFRVKERLSQSLAFGVLALDAGASAAVKSLDLTLIPPNATIEDVALDAGERHRVITGITAQLKDGYIYAPVADQMAQMLATNEKAGAYDTVVDGSAFATLLTQQLQAVSHDRHLHVRYAPFKQLAHNDRPGPEDETRFRTRLESENCEFEKVEVLAGNIGYVKFNAFAPPAFCAPTAVAAMGFLAHTDALIFDLRDNGGGDPEMVQFLLSYLFVNHTHLNDLYYRRGDSTTQYWTLPYVPGTRLGTQPVYVLTSGHTFSGGEEFTYDLQTQKRATIVGETTGGGAHPISGAPIDDHFTLALPGGRPINPVTKGDWEGTGVKPDVAVPVADALETAKKLAIERLKAK